VFAQDLLEAFSHSESECPPSPALCQDSMRTQLGRTQSDENKALETVGLLNIMDLQEDVLCMCRQATDCALL
jgi:hypothetical protein